jgi:hypothetical protein
MRYGSGWIGWPCRRCSNGYNESFNGKLGDELLAREIFYTLREAQVLVEVGEGSTMGSDRTVRWAIVPRRPWRWFPNRSGCQRDSVTRSGPTTGGTHNRVGQGGEEVETNPHRLSQLTNSFFGSYG